jgi:dUTP pyrophosphatase
MEIRIVNKSRNPLPEYQSAHAAGLDLYADLSENMIIKSMGRSLIPTGLYVELPQGFEAQVRPRSGMAIKHGISVLNTPGTIDADYRGEIKVILINLSDTDFQIKNGDRIAQLVIARYEKITWFPVDKLEESERSQGGFGSTGL